MILVATSGREWGMGMNVMDAPAKSSASKDYAKALIERVKAKNPAEPEFHQAVYEVIEDPRADRGAGAGDHVPRALGGRPGPGAGEPRIPDRDE
jgi:hypothetical protein